MGRVYKFKYLCDDGFKFDAILASNDREAWHRFHLIHPHAMAVRLVSE